MEIELIKKQLIKSCVNNKPKAFVPYLLAKEVVTGMPNKILFYAFFKSMVEYASKSSKGPLLLRIEQPEWLIDPGVTHYNFYDSIHRYSRLTIEVKETDKYIYLDTLPF